MTQSLRRRLGQGVRNQRRLRGLTQQQLACQARTTASVLGLIERGQDNFTIDTLERILDALGVDIDDILES